MYRSRLLRSIALGLVLLFALGFTLIFPFLPSRLRLEVGQVSPIDVHAPRRITFISTSKTEEERDKVERAVEPIYEAADPEVARGAVNRARQVFDFVDSVRQEQFASPEIKVDYLEAIPGMDLSLAVISDTLTLEEDLWQGVVTQSLDLLDRVLRGDIRPEDVTPVKRQLASHISPVLSAKQAALVEAWSKNFVAPNSFLDQEATQRAEAEAREAVQPVWVTIEAGEVILRDGDIITRLAWEALGELGLRQPSIGWQDIVAQVFFVLILVAALLTYLHVLHPDFWDDRRQLFVLGLLIVLTVFGAKIMVPGHAVLPYLFPLAAVSMLLATLVNADVAIFVTALLSLILGFIAGGVMELTVLGFVGGVISSLRLHRVERLNSFLWAGVYVALSNAAVVLIFRLLQQDKDLVGVFTLLGVAIANGGLAASLTLAGFFVLGNLLGITTTLQLIELSRPTHPLLKELLLKAPGSYHHSLMVGNLAEQAAQEIGADALLARVGAYYHDVGKTLRPYFFVENQTDGVNVHERLDPKTSAQIVISHVQDGLELAKKYSLPESIQAFIPQHHGSTKADYFYHLAQERGDEIEEEDFRYPGPRPRGKEAGILMLADGVEAAVRAEVPASVEEIDKIAGRIIKARFADGQLDESDLTLRDLDRIRHTFVRVLEGVYHPRIKYPEDIGDEDETRDSGESQS